MFRDEDAFEMEWRVENARSWMKDKFEGEALAVESPKFHAQTLSETVWSCKLVDDGQFALIRHSEDKGPAEIHVKWKVYLLRQDGSTLSSDVEESTFSREDAEDVVSFDLAEVLESVDQQDRLRFLICVWNMNVARPAHSSCQTSVESWPRKCRGVTRVSEELVSVRIGGHDLIVLRVIEELSTVVKSASFDMSDVLKVTLSVSGDSEHVAIEIERLRKRKDYAFLICEVSVEDAAGENVCSKMYFWSFHKDQDKVTCTDVLQKTDLIPDNQHPSDTISLLLNIRVFDDEDITWIEETSYSVHKKIRLPRRSFTLKQNIIRLYKEGILCDFTLQMKDGNLEAHMTVLGACSPVFQAMFTNPTVERDRNSVNIPDIDKTTMESFLHYLYTEDVEELEWEKALKIYIMADKYQVLPLRDVCSVFLEKHLNKENVCQVLSLADTHTDENLKNCTIEYLRHHKSIFDSKEWDSIYDDNIKLAYSVLKQVMH